MNQPVARINEFRTAVAATYKTSFGKALRSVDEQFGRFNLEDLERISFAAPALRFAVLESPLEQQADGTFHAKLRVAAFLIAEGKGADAQVWALAEVAALLLPSQRWGLVKIQAPEKATIQPVISGGLKNRQVSVMAVEWRQTLVALGSDVFDAAGVVIEGVLVNGDELETADE